MSHPIRLDTIPAGECPLCGVAYPPTCYAEGPGHGPEPGDLFLCDGCGGVLILDDRLRARSPTGPELLRVMLGPDWPRIARVRRDIRRCRREGGQVT